ncbi:MAG: hypothetical protein WC478_01605, partial [Candidatus Omnitrophota bacterium]
LICLPPRALKELEIKNKEVFLLEVSLDKLLSFCRLNKRFIPLPRYPGISRDISFILKQEISVKDILAALKQKAGPLLREAKVADYYQGKQIPTGFRGLTLACLYSSPERTLTDAEVQPLHSLVCETLVHAFGAQMR